MADIIDRRPGGGGASGANVRYRDEGDTSFSETVSSHMRAWNTATLQWERVTINSAGELVTSGGGGSTDTELPPAVAAADGMANPTAPQVLAHGLLWNGSTWDRLRGDTANGIDVDITRLPSVEVSGTGAAVNATPIPSTEILKYQSVSVQFTGTWTATAVFEISNNNTTWRVVYLLDTASQSWQLSTASNSVFVGSVPARYFRVRLSAYSSGTVSATAIFSTLPVGQPAITANQGEPATVPWGVSPVDSSNVALYAAVPSDSASQPTDRGLRSIGYNQLWDPIGGVWNRLPGETLYGLDVDVRPANTGAVTSVNDTAASTTLLSANTDRKGFRIFNDSTSDLYVKYGTTASTTSFTVKILAAGYFEEDNYTGRVDGIWSADSTGAARITELT